MGNASSHHQNPSSTTVILQAQEHNTKLMCNIKTVQDMYQYIEIPSACLQQTLHVAKVIVPVDFANTFIF